MKLSTKLLAATAIAASALAFASTAGAAVFVNNWSVFPDGEITVNFGDGGKGGIGSANASGTAGDAGTAFTHSYNNTTHNFTDTFDFFLPTGTVFNIASSTSSLTFTSISFNGFAGTVFNAPHNHTASVDGVDILKGGLQHLVVSGNGVKSSGWSGTASFVPAPVPEPAAWGLMIVGFGGIGAMVRRRKTSAALA